MKRICLRAMAVGVFLMVYGAGAVAADHPASKRTWLKRDAIDLVRLLPAPPAADSAETREEIALLQQLQKSRTPADVARCAAENKLTKAAFEPVIGEWFTAARLPKLNALLEDAAANSKVFSKAAKAHFDRPRPALATKALTPAVEPEAEPSYPSGHSTRGILFAAILAELEPAKRAALLARGQEVGWDRVIAGVHYPSDIAAGRVLGQEIARLLLEDASFRADLAAAREEFASARVAATQASVGK